MTQAPYGEIDPRRGDPELLGRVVAGKFRIEQFLGGGAMGAVYKARQISLEKYVAVKVMHRAIAANPLFVGRFHREAKAASRLDHPNSMRVLDFGEEPDGLLYIAMEYLEGRDLFRVIHEDWPISNADIGDILMQALAAVAVAHEMGVIHRDLKPENLMILRAKNDEEKDAYLVKVCDFGIAKITEKVEELSADGRPRQKLTTQGLVVGTPEYMSPEQAKGEKLDARADIYSMGIILYQLLTGRTPFTADTPLAVVLKHITEAPVSPSVHYAGVHKGLEAVAMRALAKDCGERFQTARAMRNAIREAIDGRSMPPRAVPGQTGSIAAPPNVGGPSLPGAGPVVIASAGGEASRAESGAMRGPRSMVAAVGSAPTVASGISASRLTPLGTAATAPASRKSRAGLVVGLAGIALFGSFAVVAAPRLLKLARPSAVSEATPSSAVASAPLPHLATPTSGKTTITNGEPAPPSIDPKAAKRNAAGTSGGRVGPTTRTAAEVASPTAGAANAAGSANTAGAPNTPNAAAPNTPAAGAPSGPSGPNASGTKVDHVDEPPAPPVSEPPTAAMPATASTVATPPPSSGSSAFNASTCHAVLGIARGTGATNARDLAFNGTAAAWSQCAQRELKERPTGPISAVVHLVFSDAHVFRGASCASCPAPVASCIQATTPRTVSVTTKSGEAPGEPAFDVPITFTCE